MSKRRVYVCISTEFSEVKKVTVITSVKKLREFIDQKTAQFTERTWRQTVTSIHDLKPVTIKLPNNWQLVVNECNL